MKKRLVSTITALVMLAFTAINQGFSGEAEQTENSAFTITSHAADIVIYNGDTMSTFSDRTAESVAKKYTSFQYFTVLWRFAKISDFTQFAKS